MVLPAPKSPVKTMSLGGCKNSASSRPSAIVSSGEWVKNSLEAGGIRGSIHPDEAFVGTFVNSPKSSRKVSQQVGRDQRMLSQFVASQIAGESVQKYGGEH